MSLHNSTMKQNPIEDAKGYIASRQIPQLFECLMTGLMFNRPESHLDFLIDCLTDIRENPGPVVSWKRFVESRNRDVLPPITSPERSQHGDMSDDKLEGIKKSSPLPPISRKASQISTEEKPEPAKVSAEDESKAIKVSKPIVLVFGSPGSGRGTQCGELIKKIKNEKEEIWAHVSAGNLLRHLVTPEASAGDRWQSIRNLITQGELAPSDLTLALIQESITTLEKSAPSISGFLLEGYPRNLDQLDDYQKYISRVDLVVLLECDKELDRSQMLDQEGRQDCNTQAVDNRLSLYKTQTRPVINSFETQAKLVTLKVDREKDKVADDFMKIIEVSFYGKKPDSSEMSITPKSGSPISKDSSPGSRLICYPDIKPVALSYVDEGRSIGLPTAPIIFVMGGPGSGKKSQCKKLVYRFPNFVHISMGELLKKEIQDQGTSDEKWLMIKQLITDGELAPQETVKDLLIRAMNENSSAKGFIVEGYPRDVNQLEEFNKDIGGLTVALLLDCSEDFLQQNIQKRVAESTEPNLESLHQVQAKRLDLFKKSTLPIVRYLDENKLLTVVNGERDVEDVHYDLASVFSYLFYKDGPVTQQSRDATTVTLKSTEGENTPIPVEEEVIAAKVAETTGESDETLPPTSPELETEDNMAELKNKKVIFVVGGPGCGKGTQCAKIVEKYGFHHLSSGDLLRAEVQSGSARGKELTAIMESGALVSLDIVLTLLKEAMMKNTEAKGFLIDGYPRELEQGVKFENEIVGPACVLYFEVPDETMVERLLERAKTSGRVDDNEETIKKRLKTFHDHSDSVLQHYEKQSLLCKIPATGTVDSIFGEVTKKIDSL